MVKRRAYRSTTPLALRSTRVGREAPGLLHALLMLDHDSADRRLLLRHQRVAQHLGVPALGHPLARRLTLAVRVGDHDALAEPDDVTPAEGVEVDVQLLVAEAAVGEDRDVDVARQDLVQPIDQLRLVLGASVA
jgi:hypothetical protein